VNNHPYANANRVDKTLEKLTLCRREVFVTYLAGPYHANAERALVNLLQFIERVQIVTADHEDPGVLSLCERQFNKLTVDCGPSIGLHRKSRHWRILARSIKPKSPSRLPLLHSVATLVLGRSTGRVLETATSSATAHRDRLAWKRTRSLFQRRATENGMRLLPSSCKLRLDVVVARLSTSHKG
jgi:hypothetical protein